MRRPRGPAEGLLPSAAGGKAAADGGRANATATLRSVCGVGLLLVCVWVFARAARLDVHNPHTSLATGEGEGLEELVDGRAHLHTGAHVGVDADDGSLVVDTSSSSGGGKGGGAMLPPAHSLHLKPGSAGGAPGSQTIDPLPDPVTASGAAQLHHAHPVHAARLDPEAAATGLYALSAVDIHGKERHLNEFAGKVTVVVNVASKCGYTESNYKGLQQVYEKYQSHGLEVLAFPCNQFGGQEPGSDAEVAAFATGTYHTTFTLFSKVDVNGPSAHPVWKFLKSQLNSGEIGWNFFKFVVGRDGKPVKMLNQAWDRAALEHEVYELLKQPAPARRRQ